MPEMTKIAHHQRRGRRSVVHPVVRHLGFPQFLARPAVERDEAGAVLHREEPVAVDRRAAVDPNRGVAQSPLGALDKRTSISTELLP